MPSWNLMHYSVSVKWFEEISGKYLFILVNSWVSGAFQKRQVLLDSRRFPGTSECIMIKLLIEIDIWLSTISDFLAGHHNDSWIIRPWKTAQVNAPESSSHFSILGMRCRLVWGMGCVLTGHCVSSILIGETTLGRTCLVKRNISDRENRAFRIACKVRRTVVQGYCNEPLP